MSLLMVTVWIIGYVADVSNSQINLKLPSCEFECAFNCWTEALGWSSNGMELVKVERMKKAETVELDTSFIQVKR